MFTAIRVCLYGHIAFGYKSAGKLYYKELFSLINDKARLDGNDTAYVKIAFSENRIDDDEFVMTRKWNWNNTNIAEDLSVSKNGVCFAGDALVDFQNYLLHLIPPDLLDLYFFDDEKFSDFLKNLIDRKIGGGKKECVDDFITSIREYFDISESGDKKILFELSGDEEAVVFNAVSKINGYDGKIFEEYKKRIDQSVARGKSLQENLKKSSVENFENHVLALSELNFELQKAQDRREKVSEDLQTTESEIETLSKVLESTRRALESELKQRSVSALSDRMLLLVEELQEQQYRKLIASVESDLNKKFKQLIRKDNFVSDIYIDLDFTLHLMRNRDVTVNGLRETLRKHGIKALKNSIKKRAYDKLIEKLNTSEDRLEIALAEYAEETIELPVEIDYTRFSNGEKQILVMSLYWAITNQSCNELPFIIDTPFARIDTEHRSNITEMFFKELQGQLFILSTNEELRREHLAALDRQIAQVYLLEYGDDKRTHIARGNYFEA